MDLTNDNTDKLAEIETYARDFATTAAKNLAEQVLGRQDEDEYQDPAILDEQIRHVLDCSNYISYIPAAKLIVIGSNNSGVEVQNFGHELCDKNGELEFTRMAFGALYQDIHELVSKRLESRAFRRGDLIRWNDPDQGLCNKEARIKEIEYFDGDSEVSITFEDESELHALIEEIEKLEEKEGE